MPGGGGWAFDLQLFAQEKTEPATPKRREEARRRGQVARTGELGTALILLAGFGAGTLLAGNAGSELTKLARRFLGEGMLLQPDPQAVQTLFIELVLSAALVVAPLMVVALFVGVAGQVAQVGFHVSGEALKPRLERINPLAGFKRLFSRRALVELFKSIAKITIVGWIAYNQVSKGLDMLPGLTMTAPTDWIPLIGDIVLRTGLWIGLALLIIAGIDYAFQRAEHERNLRMSRQEVMDELKQTEGDPQLRSRIRQRQRELAMRRMMEDVPTADVIITNPTELAVALKYDLDTMEAPVVVAKGAGPVARRIREVAEEHDVPLVEDRWLARTLYDGVELGQPIPVDLYQAVADVLAFVYRMGQGRR